MTTSHSVLTCGARLWRSARKGQGWLTTLSWSSTGQQVAVALGRTIHVIAIPSGEVHQLPFPEQPDGPREDIQARFVPGSSDLLVADGESKLSVVDALSAKCEPR